MKKSKVAQELIIQCTPRAVKARRAYVRFDANPLGVDDHPLTNKQSAYTSGSYTIKFKPGVPGMEKKPFAFNIDFLPGHRLRTGSYESLKKAAKKYPEIDFLIRYTNLTSSMFRMAKGHIDMPFSFSINWDKLERRLKANGETRKNFLWEVEENDA